LNGLTSNRAPRVRQVRSGKDAPHVRCSRDGTSNSVTAIRKECHPSVKGGHLDPRHLPETLSSRTVLFHPPLANYFPSGLRKTLETEFWRPLDRRTSRPLFIFHHARNKRRKFVRLIDSRNRILFMRTYPCGNPQRYFLLGPSRCLTSGGDDKQDVLNRAALKKRHSLSKEKRFTPESRQIFCRFPHPTTRRNGANRFGISSNCSVNHRTRLSNRSSLSLVRGSPYEVTICWPVQRYCGLPRVTLRSTRLSSCRKGSARFE
jgi:hypothetical protein